MHYLTHWITSRKNNTEKTKYQSGFEKAAEFHIQFERIHPFSDGNGRTGRILVNFILLKDNKTPIVIEWDDRAKYFDLLSRQDTTGMAEFFQSLSKKEENRMKQFILK